jgi:hypothetical protein
MINKKFLKQDIADSPEDQKRLRPDKGLMQLPEIKDIPGAARSGKNAGLLPGDTTISSADEEGEELFETNDSKENADISPLEKKLLNDSFDPSYDTDLPISSLSLDNKDNEGDLLQEGGLEKDLFGKDLDDDLVREEDEETQGEDQQ